MYLAKVSIKRPYFISMINLLILIFGLVSFPKLPVQENPNVELPFVSISVRYPGVNPKTAEDLLLKPLENELKGVSGLKEMRGSAYQDGARVFLKFSLNIKIDNAVSDVRDKLNAIRFPSGVETPIIRKINDDDNSIMSLSVTSDTLSFKELSDFVNNDLQAHLQTIDGVGDVSVYGDQTKEIQIQLNPSIIHAMKISPTEIEQNIKNQILNEPSGVLRGNEKNVGISTYSIPTQIDSVAKLPLNLKNNTIIRLEDIAKIKDTYADPVTYSELNGKKTISLDVFKKSQGNVVNISKNVKKMINKYNIDNNKNIEIVIVNDNSNFISEVVRSRIFELILAIIFAVAVVYVFLHNWRNTLICAVAIPVSLIGTFFVANYLNFSINYLTLVALTLSVGILVDDAIVVIENIHRHLLMGKKPLKAAADGASEIGFAAIAVTLAIVAVFIPVAFMDGVFGRYFYEFGVTVATAVLISLLVALTLVPMLSSKFLKENIENSSNKNPFEIKFNSKLDQVQIVYKNLLQKVLKYKKSSVFLGFIIFILSIVLLNFVPKSFVPEENNNVAHFNFYLEKGTNLNSSIARGQELDKYIRKLSGVENVVMNVGSGKNSSFSNIQYIITLVASGKRNFSKNEFISFLQNDAKKFLRSDKEKFMMNDGYPPIQVNLFSMNTELINEYSKKVIEYMHTLPKISGIKSSLEDPIQELRVVPDLLKAASLNVDPKEIFNVLKLLYGGVKVGNFYADGKFYEIKIMLPLLQNQTLSDLNGVLIPTKDGSSVLLSSVASIENIYSDAVISHLNGNNMMRITANYLGSDLNKVTMQIQEFVNSTKPFNISNNFSGNAESLQELISTVAYTLLLSCIFIFMVLAAQFESFKAPLSIMLSIPFAFSGSFIGLLITRQPLTIYSMIGIIMLMGLVTKNAILLIEFTQQKITQGNDVVSSLLEATQVRFRPIMMTTLTMIAGMIPMLFSKEAGSVSMGVTVIGGLISSTLLTLFIVPCAYCILNRIKLKSNY
ncbi:MAG: AcrB/AcrD/AcrF family protein [Spirobacillus cienkowskii]|jgi:HAE1 family hydrophobic/amphiphilic exporter-1|uniref:AcrB/AcrD/AcrF family protein n=1 Tax=Spirobacillus cienkowskii TaxID=495820 RepID=A0A369KTX9_9BACT|nr:MAG: AcrB/AcrD/AcrF family protein [Spirobacillus cienkowskii]